MMLSEKFWDKVDQSHGANSCWEWEGARSKGGYGQIRIDGTLFYSHRLIWEQIHGPIQAGKVIDHICFNPSCVNPAHLRLASVQQNEEHLRGAHRNNKSCGIRGVTWSKRDKKWVASAWHKRHRYHGGYFTCLRDAEQAAINLRNKLMTFNDLDRTQPTVK